MTSDAVLRLRFRFRYKKDKFLLCENCGEHLAYGPKDHDADVHSDDNKFACKSCLKHYIVNGTFEGAPRNKRPQKCWACFKRMPTNRNDSNSTCQECTNKFNDYRKKFVEEFEEDLDPSVCMFCGWFLKDGEEFVYYRHMGCDLCPRCAKIVYLAEDNPEFLEELIFRMLIRRRRSGLDAKLNATEERRLAQEIHKTVAEERKRTKHFVGDQCEICGSTKSVFVRNLCWDHDHKTGLHRGTLCPSCNKGLGNFKDSPEMMLKAIEYLNDHARRTEVKSA